MNETLLKKAKNGDKNAEAEIIEKNMGLVYMIVKRFSAKSYETEDLVQIGSIGLLKAVRKFDFNFNVKFSTYAVPMIMGEIRRFLRDDGSIKVSRSIKELAMAVYKTKDEIQKSTGREASVSEIAEILGRDTEDIVQAINASAEPKSMYTYDSDGNEVNIIDKSLSEEFENDIINKVTAEEILDKLNEREKIILICRYFREKTQSEIARILSISQVQVSRLEKAALKKIKSEYFKIESEKSKEKQSISEIK